MLRQRFNQPTWSESFLKSWNEAPNLSYRTTIIHRIQKAADSGEFGGTPRSSDDTELVSEHIVEKRKKSVRELTLIRDDRHYTEC